MLPLLAALRVAGVTLRVDGERLLVSPASLLTPEQRTALTASKAEVMAALAKEEADTAWFAADPALNDYRPDFGARGPVVLAEIAVVDLGDGRKTAMDPAEWERFRSEVAAWNDALKARDGCQHARTTYYRKTFVDGGGFHIVQWCLDCEANARGPGRWAPRSAVPNPEALPELPPECGGGRPTLFKGDKP